MEEMVIVNLTKDFYTKEGEMQVLSNISFTLFQGEILSLLGPSGSGKSTILNILTKLLEPTSGSVTINGTVGYMFQKDHLLEWRSIMDNITLGLEIMHKKNDKKSMERIERLLKTYGLWDFRNMYPKDEPFSALDYQTRLMVNDDVYKIIKNENKSVILVTHDISEAIAMGDKVAVLSKRPSTIKNEYKIDLSMEEEKTPFKCRKVPKFQTYFDLLWKELDNNEL